MTATIRIENLSKSFGREEALKKADLTVGESEIFGLVGPSGSGKSTLLRVLTGYLWPSAGTVRVLGTPPGSFMSGEKRRVGFMPQGFALYDELSVVQNLNFVARIFGLGFGARRRRVREVLEFVELWDDRRKAARNVSGGMRRRLQLAAAIVHEPDLLFVDEPTANLDPILRRKFWTYFEHLRQGGRTIFVTTQYVGEAELCDRVGFLVDGWLVAVGTPDELRRRAFGGEPLKLVLEGNPSNLAVHLGRLEEIGSSVEVRQEEEGAVGAAKSRISLLVGDADVALPRVLEVLEGAKVYSADAPKTSFDEVFFRLVERRSASA